MIIETSKDILYVTLAFCVLWLTIFFSWLLYYFITIVKSMSKLMTGVGKMVDRIEEAAKMIRDKVEHSASYIGIFAEGIKQVVAYALEKKREMQEKKEEPVKSSKKKKEENID